MECWFNQVIELRKGDIVKIVRAFKDETPLRVTVIENMTNHQDLRSIDEGIVMSKSPVTLAEPIIGKVISSTRKSNSSTSFVIEKGHIKIMYSLELERSKRVKTHSETYSKISLALMLRFATLMFHLTLSSFCLMFAVV